ncbi:MAG TPA: hypothetical protein VGM67_15275 [Gemmatimonadaceae bacterium]|jgi:hypothetical protein
MGYETRCRVRVDDGAGSVRDAADAAVLIETDDLVVRGPARITIPRASIQSVRSRAGVVTVASPAGTVTLFLDDRAEKWRTRLSEQPKRLIDKLDVAPGAKVWTLGVDDETLIAQLGERTTHVTTARSATNCNVVFVGVETERDLARIDRAMNTIVDAGAIWVVHRKGKSGVADTTIFAYASALGLAYTKVARVSDTHTAEKLVIPVARRGQARRKQARHRSSS